MSITMGLHLYVAVIFITIGEIWAESPPRTDMFQGSQQAHYIPEECLTLFPGGGPPPAPPPQPQYLPTPSQIGNAPPSSPPQSEDSNGPFSEENSRSEESLPPEDDSNLYVPPAVVPPDAIPDNPPPPSPSVPMGGVSPPPQSSTPPNQQFNPNTPKIPSGDGNTLCMDTRYLPLMDPKFTEELRKQYETPPPGLPPMTFYPSTAMPQYDIPFPTQMPPAGSVNLGAGRRYVPFPMSWQMGYSPWSGPTFAYPQFYKSSPKEEA